MLLGWKRREAASDAATINYLVGKNKIEKFRIYHIERKEFRKLDMNEVLKVAAVTPYQQETISLIEHKHHLPEIREEKLTREREKKIKFIIREIGKPEPEVRTALLAKQIDKPVYDKHPEGKRGET